MFERPMTPDLHSINKTASYIVMMTMQCTFYVYFNQINYIKLHNSLLPLYYLYISLKVHDFKYLYIYWHYSRSLTHNVNVWILLVLNAFVE